MGAARPPGGWPLWGSDHRDGAAPGALQLAGDREGLFGWHEAHLLDRFAAPPEELLLAGVGAAFDPIGIEVNDDAADFAAGGRGCGHGLEVRDPIQQRGPRRGVKGGVAPRGAPGEARRLRSP